ncbi:MAG: hypothetical protein A3F31_00505 [Candidatus Levybacteria bacterium RIFCSPHIGHO2_12_FULL_38_12]|nr:MAG: hypothetical protein A3F31_00505 [Candidatus Levybacteria bacterium RIFCSPHIGHO2_12_FULL_38_12]OGH34449.1 MAG: hypothetical protein A3A47_00655 [Candidatus Levybacteria bacterium RIFCSPLOWO2_01_FULL_37_20]OGH44697.1 MAG: hypothetical protein A3J14_00015 [Candidatus Levybacteria bacterium RIFCSPLOWO2_02_FULL_37_18]OGH51812.1 MAG: hypothetical protein A3G13_00635 [Candidatus Levybacteria bacterium RIFCSPLOWO2_12_FULL_37_7]
MVKQNKKDQKQIATKGGQSKGGLHLPNVGIGAFADEIAKLVVARLPQVMQGKAKKKTGKVKKIDNAFFFDTSAIIDGRIFDVIKVGLFSGVIALPEIVLLELKHIADSTDMVKRERGRKGLESLEKLKKTNGIKFVLIPDGLNKEEKEEVDEVLIKCSKSYKGRIITCDYNLEKKARIQGVIAVNMNAVANMLKVTAVPGESLTIKILHVGKDSSQGVGYLDDGTMIVVEDGSRDVGSQINVVISRVIQTDAGRILFAKKI